ncbi:hypothetical protein RhiirA4_480488 [Rhizophagus irregularis]|uniref:Uncharacterized protein n=1 Tax=Rhizophagus irregularis TaxID=588596 RepID=A0A2I1HI11_9GLOM|nr:hypothetical protein RhiirA4_480488 [Rhizophagus irregularis]
MLNSLNLFHTIWLHVSIFHSVIPHLIITGNSIKATFDKDALAEIHASLNNIDKLRSLVAKCYKNMHSVQCKKFDIHNYVRYIEQIEDGQMLIICMLDFQAKELQTLKCFQIDLTFKDSRSLSGMPVKFYYIDGSDWECILADLDSILLANLIAKKFDHEVYQLASSIPSI